MNLFTSHTSNTLALLAILLLPVQQSVVASCCCRVTETRANLAAAGLWQDSHSQREWSPCSSGNSQTPSCCNSNSSDSNSRPCQCPCGCCKMPAPDAVDPALTGPSMENDLLVVELHSDSTTNCVNAPQHSLEKLVANFTTGGSERCVQLCRFQL